MLEAKPALARSLLGANCKWLFYCHAKKCSISPVPSPQAVGTEMGTGFKSLRLSESVWLIRNFTHLLKFNRCSSSKCHSELSLQPVSLPSLHYGPLKARKLASDIIQREAFPSTGLPFSRLQELCCHGDKREVILLHLIFPPLVLNLNL